MLASTKIQGSMVFGHGFAACVMVDREKVQGQGWDGEARISRYDGIKSTKRLESESAVEFRRGIENPDHHNSDDVRNGSRAGPWTPVAGPLPILPLTDLPTPNLNPSFGASFHRA